MVVNLGVDLGDDRCAPVVAGEGDLDVGIAAGDDAIAPTLLKSSPVMLGLEDEPTFAPLFTLSWPEKATTLSVSVEPESKERLVKAHVLLETAKVPPKPTTMLLV